MASPYNVHCYHIISPGRVIISVNTDTIWAPARASDRPAPRLDGWWGPHEYAVLPQPFESSSPYLAWIPLLKLYDETHFHNETGCDPTLVRLTFDEYPLSPTSDLPSQPPQPTVELVAGLPHKPRVLRPTRGHSHALHITSSSMCTIAKTKVYELITEVSAAITTLKGDSRFDHIRYPEQALFRLEQAYLWMRLHNTTSGHRLVLAGLKRAVLELHGFLLWHRYYATVEFLEFSPDQRRRELSWKTYPTRGVYVDNISDYNTFGRRGIAAFHEISLQKVSIPFHARAVDLLPIPIERNLLFPEGYSGGHHCYVYFYPPVIHEDVPYELAARGYWSRSDIYRPNKEIDKSFANMCHDQKVAETMPFPYISGPISHLVQRARDEYSGIQSFAPVPPLQEWALARQQMEYPPGITGKSRPPKVRTAIPPPLFFFKAATPQKQMSFFYIWCCIRENWVHRWTAATAEQKDGLLLTHDRWREVLSGEIFRKSPSGIPYALDSFWRSDPGFINDNASSSSNLDLGRHLSNMTPLQPQFFQDSHAFGFELKRLICYDVALLHVQHQFETTDDHFLNKRGIRVDSAQAILRRNLREDLFRTSVMFIKETPPWESSDIEVKAAWYERLRCFVQDWEVKEPRLLCKRITPNPDLKDKITSLLLAYFEGVAIALNTVPTVMWTFPVVPQNFWSL